MIKNVTIKTRSVKGMIDFIQDHGYYAEALTDTVLKVGTRGGIDIFINSDELNLYFQAEIGNVKEFQGEDLYFKLLDLNTEILPVSVGIDTTDQDEPKLVLLESREIKNLDDNELLSVFNALQLAADKVEELLAAHLN